MCHKNKRLLLFKKNKNNKINNVKKVMNLGSCSLAYAELPPFFSYEDKTPPNYVVCSNTFVKFRCSNTFVKFRCKKLVKKKGLAPII